MLTDMIAQILEDMLNEGGGTLEFRRNKIAARLGCVPSQINYVLSSRFTPERGYIIRSQRGGGGYIRLVRKELAKDEYLMHFFCAIGDRIAEGEALAYLDNLRGSGLLTEREERLMASALSAASFASLSPTLRPYVRASVFRQMILSMMSAG